ncbi:MAG TPA: nucleotidyltransferase family protein [Chloroflexota bacterium]|jgi:hypothetical protein|nr:nucleotidyltransferase family protein [Chloroflexota bacterium]
MRTIGNETRGVIGGQGDAARIAAQNLAVWTLALPALRALESAFIPFIVFKSLPQLEELYGDVGARQSTDVDVLVHATQAVAAIDALRTCGCTIVDMEAFEFLEADMDIAAAATFRPWLLELSSSDLRVVIDLHTDARHVPWPWYHPTFTHDVWHGAKPVTLDGVSFLTLSEEERFIFLCWHLLAHQMSRVHRRDLEVILGRTSLDWNYISRRATEAGVAGMVEFVCHVVESSTAIALDRDGLGLPQNRRQRLLQAMYLRRPGELDMVAALALRAGMHDRLHDVIAVLREAIVPSRDDVAVNYLHRRPSNGEYALTVVRVYRHRISKRVRK